MKPPLMVWLALLGVTRGLQRASPSHTLTACEEAKLVQLVKEASRLETVRGNLSGSLGRAPSPQEWAVAAFPEGGGVDRLVASRRAAVKARAALVDANYGLVITVARRQRSADLDDLVQEGILGLMRAVDKFDPGRGVRLSTYATIWIRSTMAEYRRRSLAVNVPQRVLDVKKRRAELASELDRDPTSAELETSLGVPHKRMDALFKAADASQMPLSLEQALLAGKPIAESLVAENEESGDAGLRAALFDALETHLDDRELRVVRLRYGLDDGVARSCKETATILGIGKETVRLTTLKAFRRLRGTDLGTALLDYLE